MKIELKNISYNKRLSQESSAYAADIYVDGIKSGTVRNDGHGGMDFIDPPALHIELSDYAKTLPDVPFHGMNLKMTSDLLLGKLLEKHLAAKELQKKMKTTTFFTAKDGRLYSIKGLQSPKDAVQVLNNLPLEQAVEVYLSSTS